MKINIFDFMSFVYPSFLFALAVLAVPIIIHLFHFRKYKTVYFTNVHYLKEINNETTNRSRIKHILVLASRLLALTFLVLAFAQPYLPRIQSGAGAKKETSSVVSIYLDNSFSMNAASESEPLLQWAKKKVIEIVNAYDEDAKFQLVTNDFTPRQQHIMSKDDIRIMLDELQATPVVRTLQEVQYFQLNLLNRYEGDKSIFWISDFQKNIVNATPDSTITYFLIPLQPIKQHNIYIDTCWLANPVMFVNQPNHLLFRISNAGEKAERQIKVTMSINDQIKAITEVSIDARSSFIDTLSFSIQEHGWQKITVHINDFPITFDDKYYLTFRSNEKIKILAINQQESSNFLNALFAQEDNYQLDNSQYASADSITINSYNLVILNNINMLTPTLSALLEGYLKNGGSILLFPSPVADVMSYNRFLNVIGAHEILQKNDSPVEVSYLNLNSELLADVFEKIPQNIALPRAKIYYEFTRKTRSNEQVILGLKNNAAFLSQYNFHAGRLVVCASPLGKEYSDFPLHSLFVPIVYKMAVTASARTKASYVIGEDKQIEIINNNPAPESIYKISNAQYEWIPAQRSLSNKVYLHLDEHIREAGFFELKNEKRPQSEWIALNYNRRESDISLYDKNELRQLFRSANITIVDAVHADLSTTISEWHSGIALWKVCIILALVFLASEVLLLRFYAKIA